jgi:hypothetical protein
VVRCACGETVTMYRLSGVVNAAMCTHCGRWFTVNRRSITRRLTDLLVKLISGCSHPDDIRQVPWTPF